MTLHYGDVDGIAGGEMPATENNFLGALDVGAIHSQYLIRHAEQGVKCGLNRIVAFDRSIAMENFLQHFGVGDQTLALAHQFF